MWCVLWEGSLVEAREVFFPHLKFPQHFDLWGRGNPGSSSSLLVNWRPHFGPWRSRDRETLDLRDIDLNIARYNTWVITIYILYLHTSLAALNAV